MRTVAAKGIVLEPLTRAHAGEMFEVLSDPAIYIYENAPPKSLEWLRTRFEKLETRRSGDGRERWLNWVIRLPSSELIGYVQATLREDGSAGIAYELNSAHWGKGLARKAVSAMLSELAERYRVRLFTAVAKRENFRSTRLLDRLGFAAASDELRAKLAVEAGEVLMCRDSFEVRRANEHDREAIETLYRDCRRDADWLPAARTETTFARASEGEAVYVAMTAGRLEGFVSVWEVDSFIHHLYVREGSRGRGIGTALLASLTGRLAFPWRLKCVRANGPALDFYERHGWQRKGDGKGSEGVYVELQLDAWSDKIRA